MDDHEHESLSSDAFQDDFRTENVEMSDLPLMEDDHTPYPPGISSAMAKLGARLPKQRRTWRWLMGAATISLLLGLLLSNVSTLKTNMRNLFPASTPVATNLQHDPFLIIDTTPDTGLNGWEGYGYGTPIPLGKGRPRLTIADPAPQNCALTPPVTASREIGQSPVWLFGFDGPRATIHLRGFSEPVAHNVYGWPTLIQLMVKQNFTQPVTLSGNNAGSGPTIFFGFYPGERPLDSIILGTQQSVINPIQHEPGQKATWIVTMFLFGAGCYYLKAQWPGGSWTIHFAAGR